MPQNPSDASVLRDSMTREVTNDAYNIAGQIFKGQEGDVSRVSNDQVDERYRQAFANNDRQYLMQEAGRDPGQFLASMQRIGVTMPPGQEIQPEPKLPAAAKANVPLPKAPPSTLQQLYPTPQAVPLAAPPTPPVPPTPAAPMAPPVQAPGPSAGGPVVPPPAQPPY